MKRGGLSILIFSAGCTIGISEEKDPGLAAHATSGDHDGRYRAKDAPITWSEVEPSVEASDAWPGTIPWSRVLDPELGAALWMVRGAELVSAGMRDVVVEGSNSGVDVHFDGVSLAVANLDETPLNMSVLELVSGGRGARIGAIHADRTPGSEDTHLFVSTYGDGALTEKMRIAATGEVGIGTNDPRGPLHVNGAEPNDPMRVESAAPAIGFVDTEETHSNWEVWSDGLFSVGTADRDFATRQSLMSINQSGLVGIGTTTQIAPLEVRGAGDLIPYAQDVGARMVARFSLASAGVRQADLTVAGTNIPSNNSLALISDAADPSGFAFVTRANGNSAKMVISGDGNVGIGALTPGHKLEIRGAGDGALLSVGDDNGTCSLNPSSSSASWSCSSDARLKADIRDAPSSLDYLEDFRVRSYVVKNSGEPVVGVIAQEVLETHPELVSSSGDGYYAVREVGSWHFVKSVQELRAENRALKEEIRAQKKELASIAAQLRLLTESLAQRSSSPVVP